MRPVPSGGRCEPHAENDERALGARASLPRKTVPGTISAERFYLRRRLLSAWLFGTSRSVLQASHRGAAKRSGSALQPRNALLASQRFGRFTGVARARREAAAQLSGGMGSSGADCREGESRRRRRALF